MKDINSLIKEFNEVLKKYNPEKLRNCIFHRLHFIIAGEYHFIINILIVNFP
jgi:hypothetical protein